MSRPIYLNAPPIIPIFASLAAVWLLIAINSIAQLFAAPPWFAWLPRVALLIACPAAAWLANRQYFAQQTTWRYQSHSQTFEYCQWQRTRWQVQHTLAKHHIAGIAAEQIYQNGIPLTARIWLETTIPSPHPSLYTLATFHPDRETGFQAMQQAQQRIAQQTHLPIIPCVLRQADLSEQPTAPEQFQAAPAPSNPLWVFILHLIWAGIVIATAIAALHYAPQFANEKWLRPTVWAVAGILGLHAFSGCLQSYTRWRNHRTQNQQPITTARSIPPRDPTAARRSMQTTGFSRTLWFAAAIISALFVLAFSLNDLLAALITLFVASLLLWSTWQTAQDTRHFRYLADRDTFEWRTLDPYLRWHTEATAPAQDFIGILQEHNQVWLIGAAGKPNQFVANENTAYTAQRIAQATGLPVITRKKAA